jgi:uncharacterized protein DUF6283
MIKPPAPAPCGSCPYRKDVASGVWAKQEYIKLLDYDKPTGEQPPAVFLCHQQDARLCAGWVAVHDMRESLGLRLACSLRSIDDADIDSILDYRTDVPLFASGREAALHGLKEVHRPGRKAAKTIATLILKRSR